MIEHKSVAAMLAVLALLPVTAADAQDAAAGQTVFRQRCQMCHVAAPGQKAVLGPGLSGVVGRRAAATTFAYSPALKASGLTWDRATLDAFLAAPAKKVPGTRMAVALGNPAQRADLIAYLATLK